MHYFIDGYNLLFRLVHDGKNLQSQREAIIHDLNQKVTLIKLDVSIVFDATFQIGERSRSHYHQLEILFTAQGETADEYILDEVKNSRRPQQETVVTSDKTLAKHARNCSAHTESVEEFIEWLNRAYKNKLRPTKKSKPYTQPPPLPLPPPSQRPPPPKEAPLEAYTDYYTQIFETEWQEILKEEQKSTSTPSPSSPLKRQPRKSRPPQDPFQPPQTPEIQAATEMERWLKAFEKRLFEE